MEAMVDKLMSFGFSHSHARALAEAVRKSGRETIDGLRFTISGGLTSIFSGDGRQQQLVAQVDIVR